MRKSSNLVGFLYGTVLGRGLLKAVMTLRLDRLAVRFLRSPLSKPVIAPYAKRNQIKLTKRELKGFDTFRDFFVRTKKTHIDKTPGHLISPCDGWLSAFRIDSQSRFSIKNSSYQLKDFLHDEALAEKYQNGTCLIFRLCASDYHHYCYIDDGIQGRNHFIPGVLHSVQPIACEKFPVYVLNKRSWCLMKTRHFDGVVQCEIGALVVGGIANEHENASFCKGDEKGHFELAGSTIVLLFEENRIALNSELTQRLAKNDEVRVTLGEWIGTAEDKERAS